ncbi:MAG: hypothetical protein HY738_02215, partial [Bacteroidia bacterium]|nr:hypothetical protein [Bacteroidia bacterium]
MILISFEIVSVSQVQHVPSGRPLWQSGKLYLKIKDISNVDVSAYPVITLDSDNSLKDILTKYGVTNVERPFAVYRKPHFDRIYRIFFPNAGDIDNFISELKTLDFVEYAE